MVEGGGPTEASVEWTPPPAQEIATGGQVVRFFFVVRDGRGGVAFAERWLCVVP